MNEEARRMKDIVEEAWKLRLITYQDYLELTNKIVTLNFELDELRKRIDELSKSIERLEEVREKRGW